MSKVIEGVEYRAAVDATVTEVKGGDLLFEGRPIVYGELSERMAVRMNGQVRKFVEINEPGAASGILRTNPDVRLLGLNHDENHVLARTAAGTMTLMEDRSGVKVSATVAPTTYAVELRSMVERKDVNAMSYGFEAEDDHWDESDPLLARRSIRSYAQLYDVAPVTFPAFRQTEAAFRMLEATIRGGVLSPRELRALLDSAPERAGRQEGGDALPAGSEQRGAGPMCAGCTGSGDCAACAGTGKAGRGAQRSARSTQLDCAACYGTGTCRGCMGSGVTPHAVDPAGDPSYADRPDDDEYRRQSMDRERRRRHLALTR